MTSEPTVAEMWKLQKEETARKAQEKEEKTKLKEERKALRAAKIAEKEAKEKAKKLAQKVDFRDIPAWPQTLPLRLAQVRILHVLAEHRLPMKASILCERADFSPDWVGEYLGSHNPERWAITMNKHKIIPLIAMKYVRLAIHQKEVGMEPYRTYEITGAGRKALELWKKEYPNKPLYRVKKSEGDT